MIIFLKSSWIRLKGNKPIRNNICSFQHLFWQHQFASDESVSFMGWSMDVEWNFLIEVLKPSGTHKALGREMGQILVFLGGFGDVWLMLELFTRFRAKTRFTAKSQTTAWKFTSFFWGVASLQEIVSDHHYGGWYPSLVVQGHRRRRERTQGPKETARNPTSQDIAQL